MLLRTFRLHFSPGTDGLPKRLLVARWGLNKSVNGDYVVNETTVRELPANLHRVNFDETQLDFEHNTVPGSKTYLAEQEPRKIAARGQLEIVPGEGVYLNCTHWTPEGSDAAKGGHFPDLSPAILTNSRREVVFIHSVALARQGATEDLPLALNSSDPLNAIIAMPEIQTNSTIDYRSALLTLLNIKDTATDEQIDSAIKALAAEKTEVETGKKLETMSADLRKLHDTVAGLQQAAETAEKKALAAESLFQGKIIPQSAHDLPLDAFRKLVAELPADQVPLEKRTPEGLKTHSSSGVGQGTAIRSEIMANMGITKDQWEKHNGKAA